jgi:aspartate carbamoyltransferase catalytic subunit
MNRGVEIAPEAADDPRALIVDQVRNGVAVRMAVLMRLLAGEARPVVEPDGAVVSDPGTDASPLESSRG